MRLAFLNSGRRRALGAAAVVTAFALTASGAGDRASASMFGGAVVEAQSGGFYDYFVPSTPENVVWGEFPSSQAAGCGGPLGRHRQDQYAVARRRDAGRRAG